MKTVQILAALFLVPCFSLAEHPPISKIPPTCQQVTREHIAPPRIFVYQLRKSGSPYVDTFRVSGTFEGACLSDAGYFERGHKVKDIRLTTSRDFQSFDFNVQVERGDFPEIRVYNTAGDSDIYRVELPSYQTQYPKNPQRYDQYERGDGYYADRRDDYYATSPAQRKSGSSLFLRRKTGNPTGAGH